MSERIAVVKGWGCWLARSEGFRRLFGTDTIPTAYGLRMPIETVVERLRELNPGTEVVVAS